MKKALSLIVLLGVLVGVGRPADGSDPPKPAPAPSIVAVKSAGAPPAASDPIPLKGSEFVLLVLKDYAGPVTWDVTAPDGTKAPVQLVEAKPKDGVIGFIAGAKEAARYEVPDAPSTVVYPSGKGRAIVAAWGVVDGKPKQIAKQLIDANAAPQPPPPPDPNDNKDENDDPPPPPPGPKGKVASFVVVEETAEAGAFRGDILGSQAVQGFYKANKLTHRLVDANLPADRLDAFAQKWQAEAKKLVAAGQPLPVLFTFDAAGKAVSAGTLKVKTPEGLVAALGGEKHERKMGLVKAAALKRQWRAVGDTPAVPKIPRPEWKEVSFKSFLPPVYDQDGIGQCASSAACTVLETSRAIAGLPYVHFSAGDLYSRVNGGRDRGSMLEDNMAELMENGVALASTVPYVWNGRQANTAAVKAERGKYLVLEVYLCRDFDAMASALQQGFVIEHGLDWFDNFHTTNDGWLTGRSGGAGGHALCGYGLARRSDGTWGVATRNSWSEQWGVGGNCIIPEGYFGNDIGGFFAVRAVSQTAQLKKRGALELTHEIALAW